MGLPPRARSSASSNVLSLNSLRFECPGDLRNQTIQVRYDRRQRQRGIVFYAGKRIGEASLLNPVRNASGRRQLALLP